MLEYLKINSAKTLGPNHWHRDDATTVFQPDNILISSRKATAEDSGRPVRMGAGGYPRSSDPVDRPAN